MQKIEIKPNDQSLIGQKLRNEDFTYGDYLEVTAVGEKSFLAKHVFPKGPFTNSEERMWSSFSGEWELVDGCVDWTKEYWATKKALEKTQKRLAPALTFSKDTKSKAWPTNTVYASFEAAAKDHPFEFNAGLLAWPAIPNKDGYYEVEVGE